MTNRAADYCELRQITENIERVRNVVRSDGWKRIQEILAQVGISVESVHSIRHKGQHLVLKMLTLGNKETRITNAGDDITMPDSG
jgi:hypothetical protein